MDKRRESRRRFLKTTATGLALTGLWAANRPAPVLAEEKPKTAAQQARLTCSSVNYQSLPLDEACRRIASLGYQAVDIWDRIDGYLDCPHLQSVAETYHADGLAKLLEKHNLELCGFSVYMAKYPKFASLLGECGGGNAIRGSRERTSENLALDMKKFLDELKPELELCEKYDSHLLVENHGGNTLLNGLDSFKALLDLDPHPRLGFALAPHHIMNNSESVADTIRLCKDRLRFIYLWTNEAGEKQMPGLGTTDVADWFKALDEIGYHHFLTPFMHGEPEPDRMDELHGKSLGYLNQYIRGR